MDTYTERLFTAAELEPMSCDSVANVSELKGEATDYTMNPKLDGFRLICIVEAGRVSMMSRGLKWQDGKLPELEKGLIERFPVGTVLDGEIVGIREATPEEIEEGKPALINDFEYVQSVMLSLPERAREVQAGNRPLTYHCFDMMRHGGEDLSEHRLRFRVEMLEVLPDLEDDIYFVRTPYVEATQENHEAFVLSGFEGTVVKHMDSAYVFGSRGKGWFKIKAEYEMDAVIVGFVPGQGKNKGMVGSILFAQPTSAQAFVMQSVKEEDELIEASRKALEKGDVTSVARIEKAMMQANGLVLRGAARGFNDALMKAMTETPGDYIGSVVSIKHKGLMAGGRKVRHPQFFRARPDKALPTVEWHHR